MTHFYLYMTLNNASLKGKLLRDFVTDTCGIMPIGVRQFHTYYLQRLYDWHVIPFRIKRHVFPLRGRDADA
jgi:hypothetical protein